MNRNFMLAGAATAMTLGLSACSTMPAGNEAVEPAMVETISGTLSYRERIALPPQAKTEIVISDITLGNDQEMVLSREMRMIDQPSPPFPFSIDVSKLNLTDGPLYGLRAYIREPDGTVMFRSSEPFLLNLRNEEVNVGDIMLFMTSPDDGGAQDIPGVQSGKWRITQLNLDVVPARTAPVLSFGVDGRVSGTSGCNNFSAEYTLDGNRIALGPIAATKRACEAGLMEQERRFFDILGSLYRASLDGDGLLVLEGTGDQRLVAERKR